MGREERAISAEGRVRSMDIEKAIDCLKADKEYLTDMKICDGEEMDIALLCVLRNLLKSYKMCDFRHDCKHG